MKIYVYGECGEGKTTVAQLINVFLKEVGFTNVSNRDFDRDNETSIETMEDRINAIKSLGRKISAINETEIIIETVQIQRRGCPCDETD